MKAKPKTTGASLFGLFASLTPGERMRFCELLHEPGEDNLSNLTRLTAQAYFIRTKQERHDDFEIGMQIADGWAARACQTSDMLLSEKMERIKVLKSLLPVVVEHDRRVAVQKAPKKPEDETKAWMQAIHRMRIQKIEWNLIFEKLSTQDGFRWSDRASMERAYRSYKKTKSDWFTS